MKRNPLYRCFRLDKLSLLALTATLRLYERNAYRELPVINMLTESAENVRTRAEQLHSLLANNTGLTVGVNPHEAAAGGGAEPGDTLPSFAVYLRINDVSAAETEMYLRKLPLPVISTVQNDYVILDMRTVADGDVPYIALALESIINQAKMPPTR
jgi:L-seryl-tRNA(Ser) seleniumtransferase